MTDQPKTLLTALLAVQAELPNISLEKKGKGQIGSRDYKYLDLAGLHDKIMPLLNRHGLVWTTALSGTAEEPVLRYSLTHAATGEAIADSAPMMLDKPTSQALGSATTYLRRYCLLSVIGAVGDSDDDGAKATEQPRTRKPPAPVEQATIARNTEDRPLTDDELKAMRAAIVTSGLDEPLLLASVGCEGKVLLSHARLIRAKLDA